MPLDKDTEPTLDLLEDEVPVMVLTNEPTEFKFNTLEVIYKSIAKGQLGYMDGKDPETGEIVPLLVGLEPTADGENLTIWPVAKLFTSKDTNVNYLVPDGSGGWSGLKSGGELPDGSPETQAGPPEGLDKNQIN